MTRPVLLLVACLALPAALAAETPPAKTKARPPSAAAAPALEVAQLKALSSRAIGPAVMGGRISDVAYDPKDPHTFYVALATGGLVKTSDNGGSFKAIFAEEPAASIGAVAVAPSDPKLVWVGTGEANDRNSSAWGDGVYRSIDGGSTWTRVGLEKSRTIARIVVHPTDPGTAWVAAMGDLWSLGGERGLYKTTDGGATWKAVLTAPAPYGDRVGCGDVAIDPSNPDVLYAALYARRRTPWSFTSGTALTDGKDLGGIFKSIDGGATWRKLANGLPGSTQRIGLAVAGAARAAGFTPGASAGGPGGATQPPAAPMKNDAKVVYAIVQTDEGGTSDIGDVRSKRGGVFRSDDAGEAWVRVNPLNPRPFYFSQIRVDPENDQRVYVLGFALHVSDDGGKSFREDRFKNVHPDCHALAIDPRHPKRLLLGTDGGPYQSFDGAESWWHVNTMDAGEFYRINVDMSTPFRICGGLQDNLNWVGPSRTSSKEGIVNTDWINLGGGDGFYCVFDPDDPDLVYTESQRGYVHRFHLASGQVKQLRPEPAEGQPGFRFHWNSPLIGSRHDEGALYLAGNRVFKMTQQGEHWALVSPDLSTQDPQKTTTVGSGAESYGVVYTLAESPLQAGLLWAGTDDGKLWVTEDDGKSWTDLTPQLPPAAKGLWMSRVEASAHDPKVAYLAVSGFRSGNYAPLAYRTADRGRTWQSIAGDLPSGGPLKLVREDPKSASLLYAGTEFGLFVSADRGAHWVELGDLPTVAVDDIVVHPRDGDLVVATHGRSLFVLDDVRPLQELTPEIQAKDVHLFAPRPALAVHRLDGWADWAGSTGIFRGQNPPEGALLTAWVKEFDGEPVKLSITAEGGRPVANLTLPGTPGFNRVSWDLKPTKDLLTDYGGEGQKFVGAGEYTVTLTHGKTKVEQKLRVEVAPGVETR